MNKDFIADKIEVVLKQMLSNFRTHELRPIECSIFYNPKKYSSWFIVIYFADSNTLKMGIKQGLCYQIYTYLLNELDVIPEISRIDKSISFEFGKRPTAKLDIEVAFEKLIGKMNSLQKVAGMSDNKICGYCGHDFDKHQLLCNLLDEKTTPTSGWIMCPEENCNCFLTWGANYKVEEPKITSKFGRLIKKLFK